jgi:hypothetical protein
MIRGSITVIMTGCEFSNTWESYWGVFGGWAEGGLMTLHSQEELSAYASVFRRGRVGSRHCEFTERGTGGKSDIPWALLQNGASMSRTSIEILLCPYTPMNWWVLS